MDYKAACPANLTVSDIDLCALIGNLIDNAVEACEGLADPYIRLYIGVLKNQLYISVTNATKDTVRKLDSEYITTKRGNHGAWAETDQSCCGKVQRIYQPAERARRFRDGDYAAAVKSSFQDFLICSDDSTEKFCRT